MESQSQPQKPLPPVPLQPVRYSSSKPGKISRSPSKYMRRSSSVYSQNPYERIPNTTPWQDADLADPIHFSPPIAYSASSPTLGQQIEEFESALASSNAAHIDQARYDGSLEDEHIPPRLHKPSILLPPPVPPPSSRLKTHLRTVSLEEAMESMRAPGAVPMLPEEHRARMARPGSDQLMRSATTGVLGRDNVPNDPITFVDRQGRDRVVDPTHPSHVPMASPMFFQPYHDLQHQYHAVKTIRNPEKAMAPLADQPRSGSKSKAAQALGLDSIDESRPRTRPGMAYAAPSSSHYYYYNSDNDDDTSSITSTSSTTSTSSPTKEPQTSKEYHSFLRQQSRQPPFTSPDFQSPFRSSMVPRPLFAPPRRNPRLRPATATHPHASRTSRPDYRRAAAPRPRHTTYPGLVAEKPATGFFAKMVNGGTEGDSPAQRDSSPPPPPPPPSPPPLPSPPVWPARTLGDMIDGWKAGQAEKRREGLKKRIRVVGEGGGGMI